MEYARSSLVFLALLVEGAALGAALLLGWVLDVSLFPLSGAVGRDLAAGTLWALVPLALFFTLVSSREASVPGIGRLRRLLREDVRALFANARMIDLIVISVMAGFGEELLFRGIIQAKLGVVIASILFGLAHFVTPSYMIAATIMGFYLGTLASLYDSLLVPIQLHIVYDFFALVWIRFGQGPRT